MKIILFSTIIVVMISSPTIVYADLGYFEEFPRQLYNQPRICIFQPSDSRLSENTWKTWYDESKNAIYEWESMLRQYDASGRGKWHIDFAEIPLERSHLVNLDACDIKVIFRDANDKEESNGWYHSGTKTIEIIMVQMTYCGKKYLPEYGIRVNTYCRGNELERSSKMASTLRHEIGHAFGLGHYVTDDPEIASSWFSNSLERPSIMTFAHYNEQKRNITLLDINQVFKVHPNGFGETRNELLVFSDEYPKPNVVDTLDFSNVKTRSILIKKGESTFEKISGLVPQDLFMRGKDVEILIIKPDKTYEINKAKVSEKLYFEYPFRIDDETPKGKYQIQTSYFGQEIKKIEFEITDKIKTATIEKSKVKIVTTKKSSIEPMSSAQIDFGIEEIGQNNILVEEGTYVTFVGKISDQKGEISKKPVWLNEKLRKKSFVTETTLHDGSFAFGWRATIDDSGNKHVFRAISSDRDNQSISSHYVSVTVEPMKKQASDESTEPKQQKEEKKNNDVKKAKPCFLFWCG